MRLHNVGGDIVQEAPRIADFAALWLRNPGMRGRTWHNIRQMYDEQLQPPVQGIDLDRPWLRQYDVPIELRPPDQMLRWLYVFANPRNAQGCSSLQEVHANVHRCLDKATHLGAKRIAMIHIPVLPGLNAPPTPMRPPAGEEPMWEVPAPADFPGQQDSLHAAQAMIEALMAWDQTHPGIVQDVYLVDLQNDFADLLGANG